MAATLLMLAFSGCVSEKPNCSQLGGHVCSQAETCNGRLSSTGDSERCCLDGNCFLPTKQGKCGDGVCEEGMEDNKFLEREDRGSPEPNPSYCPTDCSTESVKDVLVEGHPGNNPSDHERISLVWFYYNSENEQDSFEGIKAVFANLFQMEPFKSNTGKFNIYYVGRIRTLEDPESSALLGNCGETSAWEISQGLLESNEILSQIKGAKIPLITTSLKCRPNNWAYYVREAMYAVHGEIHELGHYFGWLFDESGLRPGYEQGFGRNCQQTFEGAMSEWGSLIGQGCGDESVVDCNHDLSLGEHLNEVAAFTGRPENCFTGDNASRQRLPKENCYFTVQAGGYMSAWKATGREECTNGGKWCMYYLQPEGKFMCVFDGVERECDKEGVGCGYQTDGFRPTLSSIMRYHYPGIPFKQSQWLSFGKYNEQLICQRLYSITGKNPCFLTQAQISGTVLQDPGKDFTEDPEALAQ